MMQTSYFDMNPADRRRAILAQSLLRTSALALIVCLFSLPNLVRAAEPEFGGYCAEGLAQHLRVKTDCAVNWTAKDGKLYCFSSPASKDLFLKAPEDNIKKASDYYSR